MPFTFPGGIICVSRSFAVQFGSHFRSEDHLRRCTVETFPPLIASVHRQQVQEINITDVCLRQYFYISAETRY